MSALNRECFLYFRPFGIADAKEQDITGRNRDNKRR